ncbi:hypothetical protein HK405_015051, partial [Cladochytrium tenue]
FAYNLFVLRDRVTTHVYECMPWCGCTAEACQNRVVSGAKTPIADMTCVFWASKGRGLKAARDIIRGEYIGNFVGECISAADARRRETLHAPGNVHSILWLPGGVCIDATYICNHTRFIVYSNARPPAGTGTGLAGTPPPAHVALFAARAVQRGDELSLDYTAYGPAFRGPCRCGTALCNGARVRKRVPVLPGGTAAKRRR